MIEDVQPVVGERLKRILGIPTIRLELLQFAVRSGEVSAGDVMAHFEGSRNGARNHLRVLEAEGVLASETVRRGPGRSIVVWRVQMRNLDEVIDDLDLFLRPE